MDNDRSKRVTLDDVARAAGLGRGTVSRVLRGEAHVSQKSRKQVEKAVKALGYQPNAAARALAGQRRGARGSSQIKIAFLSKHDWFKDKFKNACLNLGVEGEYHLFQTFKNPREMTKIFYARGIDAIVINPNQIPWSITEREEFRAESFAVVVMGRVQGLEGFDIVRHGAFDYMRASLKALDERGIKRVRVFLHESNSLSDDEARLGSLMAYQELHADKEVAYRWQRFQVNDVDAMMELIREEKDNPWAEVFLFDHVILIRNLLKHMEGKALLNEQAYAAVVTPGEGAESCGDVSGCLENNPERIQRAVAALLEKVKTGAKGRAVHPMEHVVEPKWVDRASTLKRIPL